MSQLSLRYNNESQFRGNFNKSKLLITDVSKEFVVIRGINYIASS